MTNEDIITKAQNYMKLFHKDDTTGHDIAHIQRVTRLAEYIANNEQQGHFGEPMWIDQQSNNIKKSNQSYFDWKPSAIKHFYEKLFKLKSLMHTQTAKNLAQQRHEFMKNYVDTFFKEWYF
ncbi:hypothetical protein [Staphylococcus ureilyticus]|uniref:hypothetical protein n=1 Tax=Staphylococcus ureilyticus TaxID=94138 RepID=UPI003D363B3F